MAKKFLTLNIGAANVELAEYEAGSKGALTLVNYGLAALSAPLDGGNAETILTPALMEICRERGIRPGPVAIAVSGQMSFQRFAAIPMAGGEEKFEQMIRYEIEQNIPFPIDEMICDRQVIGDTEQGDKSVMIVAAKTDQIEAITNAVSAAGFTPTLVDVAPIAVVNAAKATVPDDGACVIILDLGAKTTTLVISEQDKLYNRAIPVAGNAITKEIATAYGCSFEDAEALKLEKGYVALGGVTEDEDEDADRVSKICRAVLARLNAEISRSINFYRSQQHGGVPTKLYLTGGTALLPQIDVFFAESLQIEVEFFNAFGNVTVGPKVDAALFESDAALLATTVGLALHAVDAARFAVNLLPLSLVEARAEKAKVPFLIVAGVALVAALVMVMMAFDREAAVTAAKRDAVQAKADSLASYDKKVKAAEQHLADAQAEAEKLSARLSRRTVAVQRLNAVRSSLVPGMWIDRWEGNRITIRYWKDRVTATSGKTPGEVVVDKLKGKTSVLAPESVRIADMSAVGKDQVAQFTVEVKFK